MHDVVIVGGGFAGVTAARECALRGRKTMVLEGRDRLGGRTWSADWAGTRIELGGAWVHWHQPHTFSELTRAGLPVQYGRDAEHAAGTSASNGVRGRLPSATGSRAAAGTRSCRGSTEALPLPHAPLYALAGARAL